MEIALSTPESGASRPPDDFQSAPDRRRKKRNRGLRHREQPHDHRKESIPSRDKFPRKGPQSSAIPIRANQDGAGIVGRENEHSRWPQYSPAFAETSQSSFVGDNRI